MMQAQQAKLMQVAHPNGDTAYAKIPPVPASMHWRYVERMPLPAVNIDSFIRANLYYPPDARKKKKQGRVAVMLTIDAAGDIRNVHVLKPFYPSIDAEAIRVINMLPPWTPAWDKGKNISLEIVLPVEFKL